jgi:hypothetical protein
MARAAASPKPGHRLIGEKLTRNFKGRSPGQLLGVTEASLSNHGRDGLADTRETRWPIEIPAALFVTAPERQTFVGGSDANPSLGLARLRRLDIAPFVHHRGSLPLAP